MFLLKGKKIKSAIASLLAGALITTSPGLFSYQAFARVASGATASGRATAPSVFGNGAALSLTPNMGAVSLDAVGSLELRGTLPALAGINLPNAASPTAVRTVSPKTARGAFAVKTAPIASPSPLAVKAPGAQKSMSGLIAGMVKRFAPVLPGADAQTTAAGSPKAASTLRREFDGSKGRLQSASEAAPVSGKFAATRPLLGRSAPAANAADQGKVPAPKEDCVGSSCGHNHGVTDAEGTKKTSPLQWVMAGASAATIIGVTVFSNVSLVPIFATSAALMLSILAHESAHILGLRLLGDPTPKIAGRDHINPFMHIDPIGTILIPAASLMISQATIGFPLLFGWAKPVPVDFNNLAEPKAKNAAKVAALGPLMNLALAGLAFAAVWALPAYGLIAAGGAIATSLTILWKMNLALFAFNLLPLPWLDGGKLLVSMFPKNIYARWTANPNLPTAYQGIFKKIYEGPANVLSRFHIHSMGQINGITRVLTLTALGAFYAVFFSAMQIPFLFLALPCSYDYWCIREKVRSEQAVEEMMDLMSEWGAALAQIAEDHDAESEVSTFEAEHAMKNAVDYLLEDLMAKEEFRNLSEEDKIKEFMKHYPDWATRYLKDKVFTEDTEEKIREILADERNTPFMKRLEEWLRTHKVFDKMASPHAKKKYKDASEEADKDNKRTMGGFLPLTMLPSVALGGSDAGVFTGAFEFLASLGLGSAMLTGTTSREGANGPADKIVRMRGEATAERTVIIRFESGITEEQAREAATEESLAVESVETINGAAPAGEEASSYKQLRVTVPAGSDLPEIVARLAQLESVAKLVMHENALERAVVRATELAQTESAAPEPQTPDFLNKTTVAEDLPDFKDMRVRFGAKLTLTQEKEFLEKSVLRNASKYRWENETTLVLHVRDAELGARVIAASHFTPGIEGIEVSQIGKETYDDLLRLNAEAFRDIKPDAVEGIADAADENRGILVQWSEDATAEEIDAYAKLYDMRVVEGDYRGAAGLVLYEAPKNDQQAWFLRTIAQAVPEAFAGKIQSVRPMREDAAAAPEDDITEEEAAPVTVEMRSVHDEWVDFLNNQELITGKTLEPKQAMLIASLLTPVQPPPTEKSHPIIGRTMEQKRVIPVLTAPRGGVNSVMLVGPAGTGKTAIGEGIAQLIEDSEHADRLRIAGADGAATHLDIARLRGRWLVQLDIDRLLASEDPVGTLLALIDLLPMLNDPDMRKGNRVILMLDEIQKLALDPAGKKILNALKVPIRNGKLSVLGTTTDKEWKEHFDVDEALKSRFEKLNIEEPTIEQTQQMLHGAKVHYEWVHDAEIEDDALDAAASLSDQFDKEEHNPRKSFKLVRSAAELARPDNLRAAIALDIREGWGQLLAAVRSAKRELEKKGIASTIALPIETYNKIAELIERVVALYDAHAKIEDGKGQVTTEVIKRRLAEITGISAGQLTLGEQDSSKYLKMEEAVSERVINQDRAIKALANAIRRNKSGLADPNRPMGKFLFVGPTGVGKTHLVKELARFLFDDPEAYVRFDMSEFMEEHTYIRLIGAPPSYVGYGEGGQLTEAIRKKPYSVILLDEVEKAHPKVWNIFLQILDDGRLTDSEGRTVDFKNTVIIMTSNAGMHAVQSQHYERLLTAKYLELAQLEETDAVTLKALIDLEISELEAERDSALEQRFQKHEGAIAKARAARDGVADIRAYSQANQGVAQLEAARDAELAAVSQAFQKRIDAANARLDAPIDPAQAQARAEAIRSDIAKIEQAWDDEIQLAIQEGVRGFFTPEFLNRLDEDPDSKSKWITFNRLNKDNVRVIAGIELKTFAKLLLERHDTQLEFSAEVIDHLTNEGFSPVYGARPVKAAIEKYIVDPLAKWVLEQSEHGLDARGKKIVVSIENGTPKFEAFEREKISPDKRNLKGIAHAMTEEIMHLIEDWVGAPSEDAPVPSEALFDRTLRTIGSFGNTEEASEAPAGPLPVFAPGIEASLKNAKVVSGEHNNAKKVDKALRAGWRELAQDAEEKGFSPEAVSLLNQAAGTPGEAWVKNMLRHAKEAAAKAGKEDPVILTWEVTDDAVTVVVRSPHTMDENEKIALKAHLTGTPPADLKEAQRRVDQLNLTATMLRDSNLLDLYRRASEIPGARIGYRTGEDGTEYVLIIPKKAPALKSPQEAPASRRSVQPAGPKLTPHQIRERARTRPVFWKILHSDKQGGPAIKIAASEGWARLTTPADLKEARTWIIEGKWANDDTTNLRLTGDKHKVQLAALVFKRWATAADLPVLEKLVRTYTSSSDYDIPAKQALIDAFATVLARAGREEALAAYARGTDDTNKSDNVTVAAQRALGKVGKAEDVVKLMSTDGKTLEPDAFVDLLAREAPEQLAAFVAENWRTDEDGARFKSLSTTQKKTVLKAVARLGLDPEGDFQELKHVIESQRGADRPTLYDAGEAFAVLAEKQRLGANLERQLEEFLSNNSLNQYNSKWSILLTLLYTAQRVGGPELLPIIEALMQSDADKVSSNYEQPHFESPLTWARIVVRTGLIAQYLQRQRGEDGEVKPSKIETMLASKNPMEVAAALHAISLAQGGLGGHGVEGDQAYDRADQGELGDLIELDVSSGGGSGSSNGGYGYYNGGARGPHGHDFGWGGRWDPMRGHMDPMY